MCILELMPTELYLNRLIIEKYAKQWREIGLELKLSSKALDNIDVDKPNDVEERWKATLKLWLKRYPDASWEKAL